MSVDYVTKFVFSKNQFMFALIHELQILVQTSLISWWCDLVGLDWTGIPGQRTCTARQLQRLLMTQVQIESGPSQPNRIADKGSRPEKIRLCVRVWARQWGAGKSSSSAGDLDCIPGARRNQSHRRLSTHHGGIEEKSAGPECPRGREVFPLSHKKPGLNAEDSF